MIDDVFIRHSRQNQYTLARFGGDHRALKTYDEDQTASSLRDGSQAPWTFARPHQYAPSRASSSPPTCEQSRRAVKLKIEAILQITRPQLHTNKNGMGSVVSYPYMSNELSTPICSSTRLFSGTLPAIIPEASGYKCNSVETKHLWVPRMRFERIQVLLIRHLLSLDNVKYDPVFVVLLINLRQKCLNLKLIFSIESLRESPRNSVIVEQLYIFVAAIKGRRTQLALIISRRHNGRNKLLHYWIHPPECLGRRTVWRTMIGRHNRWDIYEKIIF